MRGMVANVLFFMLARNGSRVCRPFGALLFFYETTHGWRRGLQSCAAVRLVRLLRP